MKLIPDLRDFIELLNSESVQYLVIGGWAYNRYAEPRTTGDIDFFVSTSSDNQLRLREVLSKFGFEKSLPPKDKPLFQKKIIMLGRPPHRIDLISEIDGVSFAQAWDRRDKGLLDDIETYFISLEDLILNKKSTGRDKDYLDAKNLEKFCMASNSKDCHGRDK